MKALEKFNAEKDKILYSHGAFLISFLLSKLFIYLIIIQIFHLVKALNTLVYILHYEGTIFQDKGFTISCISLWNEISILFFYIGLSLNLFKW